MRCDSSQIFRLGFGFKSQPKPTQHHKTAMFVCHTHPISNHFHRVFAVENFNQGWSVDFFESREGVDTVIGP